MNSRTKVNRASHRAATEFCADRRCLVCHAPGSIPAHWPRHRGSGGRWPNEWAWGLWVPLCGDCHDLVDRRAGVSEQVETRRHQALAVLRERAPDFWSTSSN